MGLEGKKIYKGIIWLNTNKYNSTFSSCINNVGVLLQNTKLFDYNLTKKITKLNFYLSIMFNSVLKHNF